MDSTFGPPNGKNSSMAFTPLRIGPLGFAPGVYGSALAFVVGGLTMTDPSLQWVSQLSFAVAAGLLLWGTTINRRHLWQAWWRGPPNPFHVKAWYRPWDYEEGKEVGGIHWNKAFAHIRVNLTNISGATVEDLIARLKPDQAIIESRAKCEFAECRIGLDAELPDITIRAKLKSGAEIDIPPSQLRLIQFGPPHRLFCERLPPGATIQINLATVVPDPESEHIVKPERTDPEYLDIHLAWHVMGEASFAEGRFILRSEE